MYLEIGEKTKGVYKAEYLAASIHMKHSLSGSTLRENRQHL